MPSAGARLKEVGNDASPPKHAARSRLIIGKIGPSDSALAAASDGRLRRPAADRHAARCASRDLCSGVRPSAPYALECEKFVRPHLKFATEPPTHAVKEFP